MSTFLARWGEGSWGSSWWVLQAAAANIITSVTAGPPPAAVHTYLTSHVTFVARCTFSSFSFTNQASSLLCYIRLAANIEKGSDPS